MNGYSAERIVAARDLFRQIVGMDRCCGINSALPFRQSETTNLFRRTLDVSDFSESLDALDALDDDCLSRYCLWSSVPKPVYMPAGSAGFGTEIYYALTIPHRRIPATASAGFTLIEFWW
jgi:hypothetical protein